MRMAERIARRRQAREAAYAEQEALAAAQAAVVGAAMAWQAMRYSATMNLSERCAVQDKLDAACADLKKLGG